MPSESTEPPPGCAGIRPGRKTQQPALYSGRRPVTAAVQKSNCSVPRRTIAARPLPEISDLLERIGGILVESDSCVSTWTISGNYRVARELAMRTVVRTCITGTVVSRQRKGAERGPPGRRADSEVRKVAQRRGRRNATRSSMNEIVDCTMSCERSWPPLLRNPRGHRQR